MIISNMPEKEYHAHPALGSSPLKRFHNRPSSILEKMEQTESMALGAAQDAFTLYGREHFDKHFAIEPARVKAKSDFSAYADDLLEGKTLLPPTVTTKKIPTMKAIIDVDNALYKHPMVREIMRKGEHQLSIFWDDQETGMPCKGRIDHYPDPRYKSLTDLKLCSRISRFAYQMQELRYDIQAGHYTIGAQANGIDAIGFAFVAFNFGDPPEIDIFAMDDDYLEKSMILAKTTVRLIWECKQAGYFPDYKVPLETVSMAHMLGIKDSKIARQLAPQELIKIVQTPWELKAV